MTIDGRTRSELGLSLPIPSASGKFSRLQSSCYGKVENPDSSQGDQHPDLDDIDTKDLHVLRDLDLLTDHADDRSEIEREESIASFENQNAASIHSTEDANDGWGGIASEDECLEDEGLHQYGKMNAVGTNLSSFAILEDHNMLSSHDDASFVFDNKDLIDALLDRNFVFGDPIANSSIGLHISKESGAVKTNMQPENNEEVESSLSTDKIEGPTKNDNTYTSQPQATDHYFNTAEDVLTINNRDSVSSKASQQIRTATEGPKSHVAMGTLKGKMHCNFDNSDRAEDVNRPADAVRCRNLQPNNTIVVFVLSATGYLTWHLLGQTSTASGVAAHLAALKLPLVTFSEFDQVRATTAAQIFHKAPFLAELLWCHPTVAIVCVAVSYITLTFITAQDFKPYVSTLKPLPERVWRLVKLVFHISGMILRLSVQTWCIMLHPFHDTKFWAVAHILMMLGFSILGSICVVWSGVGDSWRGVEG